MGNTPPTIAGLKRSRRRFTIREDPGYQHGTAALFATEPKYKCDNVKMYHVYKIVQIGSGQDRGYAIIDLVNVCTDISFVRRSNVDGMM